MLGLLRATAGQARMLGRDPWREAVAVHRELAYVPGDVALWPGLTGGEVIDALTSLRGGIDEARRAELISDFDLDVRKRSRSYSKGNRQKVALVAAFARPARVYLLDEPTSGLDPLMEAVFRRWVERVRSEGATVLLSSHVLAEVEQLCDRVTIIKDGVAVETGTLAQLRHLTRTHYRVTLPTSAQPLSLHGAHGLHQLDAETIEFSADATETAEILSQLAALGATTISAAPPSLESLFLQHYSRAGAQS
jgi:ABC-2 type transport system ATP-binding protein